MMTDPFNRLALSPIGQNATHGRWRTEAMRSHSSPRLIFVARGQGRITIAGLTSGFGANIPQAMDMEWPTQPVHLRLRDVVAQKELSAHLDALERELKSEEAGHQRAAHYQLGLLSIYFERQMDQRSSETSDARSETAAARLVAAYTDLIERDFRNHMGVADYAAKLGVTPTHLARCCRQTSGKSALQLLNDRVLFEARLMLRDTTDPVQDIAKKLGFGSAAYFTRAFQSQTGLTPSNFRKKGPLSAI